MVETFKQKYLKYKRKYLQLKKQLGSAENDLSNKLLKETKLLIDDSLQKYTADKFTKHYSVGDNVIVHYIYFGYNTTFKYEFHFEYQMKGIITSIDEKYSEFKLKGFQFYSNWKDSGSGPSKPQQMIKFDGEYTVDIRQLNPSNIKKF